MWQWPLRRPTQSLEVTHHVIKLGAGAVRILHRRMLTIDTHVLCHPIGVPGSLAHHIACKSPRKPKGHPDVYDVIVHIRPRFPNTGALVYFPSQCRLFQSLPSVALYFPDIDSVSPVLPSSPVLLANSKVSSISHWTSKQAGFSTHAVPAHSYDPFAGAVMS